MKLPPLRERKSDIPLLVMSFLEKFTLYRKLKQYKMEAEVGR